MSKLKLATIWTVILAILLKVSGVVRESIIAKEFGASAETSAYYLAFSFITVVIAMVSTGFNNVFLPLYIRKQKLMDRNLDKNSNSLLNLIILLFCFISFLGWKYSWWFAPKIFGSMSTSVEEITIQITKIFFLFMVLIVLSALLDSYLQIQRIFVPSQVAKLLATLLAAIFAFLFSETWGIFAVAYGFILGTVLGTIVQLIFLKRSAYHWEISIRIEKNFNKELIILLIPSLLNAGVGQVNLLVNKSFASGTFDAAITYLNNASTITSIPNAIYATTIITVIFTLMTEHVTEDITFKDIFLKGMEISLVTLLPITIGLFLIGDLVISFLYERGKFTVQDTKQTYMAMMWYTPTIIFQGLQLILSKSMYARGKTNIVFRISVFTIVLNFLLNWFLVDKYGYVSLAFSTLIVSIYYFAVSMIVVYKDLGFIELKKFWDMSWRVLLASLVMGIIVSVIRNYIPMSKLNVLIQLLIFSVVGVIAYGITLRIFYRAGYNRFILIMKKNKEV